MAALVPLIVVLVAMKGCHAQSPQPSQAAAPTGAGGAGASGAQAPGVQDSTPGVQDSTRIVHTNVRLLYGLTSVLLTSDPLWRFTGSFTSLQERFRSAPELAAAEQRCVLWAPQWRARIKHTVLAARPLDQHPPTPTRAGRRHTRPARAQIEMHSALTAEAVTKIMLAQNITSGRVARRCPPAAAGARVARACQLRACYRLGRAGALTRLWLLAGWL